MSYYPPLYRLTSALAAGWRAGVLTARRVYANPEGLSAPETFEADANRYAYLWAWYTGSIFDDARLWRYYKGYYGLYRQTRALAGGIARKLPEFYASAVYPGILSNDGHKLPGGIPSAIPISSDTDPAVRKAVAQLLDWSRFARLKGLYVRYGAALGDVMLEAIDEPSLGRIVMRVVWPGQVSDLERDVAGALTAYTIERPAVDLEGRPCTFSKRVTLESFATFRDGKPYDFDPDSELGSEWPNPYGFVPAVWVNHIETGGLHGAPAIHGAQPQLDEASSILSLLADQTRKAVGAPVIIGADGDITPVFASDASDPDSAQREASDQLDEWESDRDSVLILQGPPNTSINHLSQIIGIADAMAIVERILQDVESTYPEASVYDRMREMSQVTGPAVNLLQGDVLHRVLEAQAGYDEGLIRLTKMGVAMAGWRANSGDWGVLGKQQSVFKPFDLDSVTDIEFTIDPRPLATPTKEQMAAEEQAFWTAAKAAKDAGADTEYFLERNGASPEEVAKFREASERAMKVAAEKFQQQQSLALASANKPPAPALTPQEAQAQKAVKPAPSKMVPPPNPPET